MICISGQKQQTASLLNSIFDKQVNEMETKKVDIAIVGAGPAGLSLALSLAHSGLKIALLEQQALSKIAKPEFDGRDIALTHLSKTILIELGVWKHVPQHAIHHIKEAKVINGPLSDFNNASSCLHFERSDGPDAPLGYLIANYQIRQALYQQLIEHPNIELMCEQKVQTIEIVSDQAQLTTQELKLDTTLLVASDSRFSSARRLMGLTAKMKDFGKVMIVCNMKHQLSHEHTAQECFQYDRTCAILPLGESESSIVITVNASESERLLALDDNRFNLEVEQMLATRLGKMSLISQRTAYPLIGVMSDRFIAKSFALIGDAAVGMHPVTAHGFNLGLRSADTLAQLIVKAQKQGKDIASRRLLLEYEARHKLLSKPLYEATNKIVALYTNPSPLAKVMRKTGITLGNQFLPFKKLVTHRLTQIR